MKHEPLTAREAHLALPTDTVPVYDAVALTRGQQKAVLMLNGQSYTLRITKQGKLLLTK
ncbi:MAG: hemin uptake protein HemP [Pseudomonadota bacterium]